MFFDGSQPAQAHAKIINVAAQNSPNRSAFRSLAEHCRLSHGVVVVGKGGMPGEGNRVGVVAYGPSVFSGTHCQRRGRFRGPRDGVGMTELFAELSEVARLSRVDNGIPFA